jgi:hypothetical protein
MLKRIMLPFGYGQTCNQLFQISHWIPAAIETGLPLYFPGFRRYAHLFSGTEGKHFPRFPKTAPRAGLPELLFSILCSYVARIPHANIGPFFKASRMLPGVVTDACDDSGRHGNHDPNKVLSEPCITAGQSLWVRGWLFRDEAGIAKHKQSINAFFSPVPEIQRRVDICIKQNRKENAVLVGVHLRRRDYKYSKYFYDDMVYRNLMQQLFEIMPNCKVRFLLVSDETVDRSNYDGLDIGMGPGDPGGDLYSLAACDYIMGPPSTFTAWASFFGSVPLYTIADPAHTLNIKKFVICTR